MWYSICPGDCLSSVAASFGFRWQQLWDDPNNADLRQRRNNPNVLYVGDQLYIPDVRLRIETRPTDNTHRFQIKGVLAKVKLRLLLAGEPRRSIPYEFVVNGAVAHRGTTDDDGYLGFSVQPDATGGVLRVLEEGRDGEEYEIQLGFLDPVTTVEGVQERLSNLGFIVGPIDGVNGDLTKAAVRLFQAQEDLDVDGIVGPMTRARLLRVHGS